MKNVRLFYSKTGRMRFVSHLDMNRFMIRAVRKAGLPIWYTEGFNPHPYLNFALPLPLGFESGYEIMDMRVLDDGLSLESICEAMNAVCPEYIRFFKAAEPVLKTGAVAFAEYTVTFDDAGEIRSSLTEFLKSEHILCNKKTKKGDLKEIDLAEKLTFAEVEQDGKDTVLKLVLPAGPNDNINPELLLNAFYEQGKTDYYCYRVFRTAILDQNREKFR